MEGAVDLDLDPGRGQARAGRRSVGLEGGGEGEEFARVGGTGEQEGEKKQTAHGVTLRAAE